MNDLLSKNDYEEPRCLLNMHPEVDPIPVRRIMEKLDSYLDRNDYDAAERHLLYWLAEADACRDARGRLTLLNEQIGLYRKRGKETECLRAAKDALALAESLEMENSVSYGTTLINAATAYKAFGDTGAALPLYEQAREIYELQLSPDDGRLGALYNNMALTVMETEHFREAEELFQKALSVMEKVPHGEADMAITLCNLADLTAAEAGTLDGERRISQVLDRAYALLDTPDLPRDSYYAFVCEKCAPTFGYYGFFMAKRELLRRAEEIYERT